jgi:hypothetical protein
MKEIWKYGLSSGKYSLQVPTQSSVLSVGIQDGDIMIWMKVSHNSRQVTKEFNVYMTGEPFNDEFHRYIGTVQSNGIVNHVFEV